MPINRDVEDAITGLLGPTGEPLVKSGEPHGPHQTPPAAAATHRAPPPVALNAVKWEAFNSIDA